MQAIMIMSDAAASARAFLFGFIGAEYHNG
jgi:hypothetical protein